MFSFLSHDNRKTLTLIGILVIAATIPLTALLAQKAQELRGRAAPNGEVFFANESGNTINTTSNVNVFLKINLPDGWRIATKDSENKFAQNQTLIPKVYASHCGVKNNCADCTNFASDCYWEQNGSSGTCKDGVSGSCTEGVTWWAYTTGQCNLPFFCPATQSPTAVPTSTPTPTPIPQVAGSTCEPPPQYSCTGGALGPGCTVVSGNPTFWCQQLTANSSSRCQRCPTATPTPGGPTLTPTPPPAATPAPTNLPSTPTPSVRTTCTSLTMSPSSGAVGERVNVVAQYTGTTPSTIEVWFEGNKLITDSVSGGGTKSVRVTIPNFALGTYTANVKFGDSNGVLMNEPSDCTARFTITSLTSPTATPPPGGGNVLSQIHIRNVDSNGTGGFDPARITGADLNPYKRGTFLLIPWKINNGNGQHQAEVVLYANNQTVQTPPITATITLTGGPTPIPTPISGRSGGLSYFCQTYPNHVLTAAFSVPSNPPFECNTYIVAGGETYKISSECGNNLTKTMSGRIVDLRDPNHIHTITDAGIYELWSSNDGTPGTRLGRVTLNCGAPAAPTNTPAPGQPTATPRPGQPTATPVPGGGGSGQGTPEVAKCESVTLNGLAPGSFPLELNKNYNARIVMRNVDPGGTITNQRDWVKSQDKLVASGNTNQIWTPRIPNPPPFTWDEGVDTIGKAPQNDRATFAFTIRGPSELPGAGGYEFKWAMQKSGTSQPFGGTCDLAFQASDFTTGTGSGQTIIPIPVLLQEFAAAPNRPARTPRRQSRPDVDVTLILTTDRTKKFEGKINLQWEGRRLDVTDPGFFNAIVNFAPNTLPPGLNTYDILVKEKNHLRRIIGTNVPITTGETHQLNRVGNLALFPGDVNNDNKVDTNDHQILVNCFGDKRNQGSCSGKGDDANLDDDEDIDIFDYNWLVENFGKIGEQQ